MDTDAAPTPPTPASAHAPDGDHVDRLLVQWAAERPELDTRLLRFAARLRRLSRYLDRESAEALAPLGLTEGESNVLAALRRAGPPYELTPTELYRSLLVSSGAMTNRLDRLEAAGMIRRTPDEADRRRIRVRLTDRGRATIDRAIDAHVDALPAVFAGLRDEDAADLERILRDLLRSLEAADPDA